MENKLLKNQVLSIKKLLETKTEDILEELNPLEWTYTVNQQKELTDAKITVAFGGPNIYVNAASATIEGYWGSDKFVATFDDKNNLYDLMQDFYHN